MSDKNTHDNTQSTENNPNQKSGKNGEGKKSKIDMRKLKKIAIVGGVIVIIAIGYGLFKHAGSFLSGDNMENKGLMACQQIYSDNVDRFTDQTGLNHGNIVFGEPSVEQRQNLYIYHFDNITLGDQKDTFLCYYNTATGQAKDRTPLPDITSN